MKSSVSLGFLTVVLTLAWGVSPLQAAPITHAYDIEHASSTQTEPGWTHLDPTMFASPGTPGFIPGSLFSYNDAVNMDRGTSTTETQDPIQVTRDLCFGNYNVTTAGAMVYGFRDVMPANVDKVTYTIYRSDPADSFAPNYTTAMSVNGGSNQVVHTGSGSYAKIHAPITGYLDLTPSASPGELDIKFLVNAGAAGSAIRIGGIELVYQVIPEPASLGLLIPGALLLWRRR